MLYVLSFIIYTCPIGILRFHDHKALGRARPQEGPYLHWRQICVALHLIVHARSVGRRVEEE